MISEIFNLFLIVSAIHGVGFCIFLLFSKLGKEKSMFYLNLFILSISLNNLQSWIKTQNFINYSNYIDYFQMPWHLLPTACFYMFLIHYLKINNKSVSIVKPMSFLFFTAIALQIGTMYYLKDGKNIIELALLSEAYISYEELVSFFISLFIYIYSFYVLYNKGNLSAKIASYDNFKWIYKFFFFGFIGYVLWVFALIVKINMNFEGGFLLFYYPLRVYSTMLIYWTGYQGIIHLRRVKEREKIRTMVLNEFKPSATLAFNNNTITNPVIVESNCSDSKSKERSENGKSFEQFSQIDNFVKVKKKFLEPKYTLQILSNELNISSSTLSAVINNNANKSFTDYLNEMRIEQAKKLLIDPEYYQYDITSIGLESGFNSKSTFYTVFKKYTNCTPVQFKKKNS